MKSTQSTNMTHRTLFLDCIGLVYLIVIITTLPTIFDKNGWNVFNICYIRVGVALIYTLSTTFSSPWSKVAVESSCIDRLSIPDMIPNGNIEQGTGHLVSQKGHCEKCELKLFQLFCLRLYRKYTLEINTSELSGQCFTSRTTFTTN